jgi:hypothetical protein
MSDQEAWQELCELYLLEQDFARAAFCMEELILHNPHSHLIHQRYAEIRYTQVMMQTVHQEANETKTCIKMILMFVALRRNLCHINYKEKHFFACQEFCMFHF